MTMSDEMAEGLANHRSRQAEKDPSQQDAEKAMGHLRAVRRFAQYALQITDVEHLPLPEAMETLARIPLDDYTTLGEAMAVSLKRLHEFATEARDLHREGI